MEVKLTITTTGGAGVSTGTATSVELIEGFIESMNFDFTSEPATADVTLSEDGGRTLWTKANAATDIVYYPMVQAHDGAGAAITGVYKPIYVSKRRLTLAIAQGDDNAAALVATIIISPVKRVYA